MPHPPPPPVSLIDAIAQRIRVVVARQPGHRLDEVAHSLWLEPGLFVRLMTEASVVPDTSFLLDAVASLAYCQGVDPSWLLTGHYDSRIHRRVLVLGEERGVQGLRLVRELVGERFTTLSQPLL